MSIKQPTGLKGTDLEKGLALLENAARVPSRRAELFQKSESGEITDAEREELIKSLGSPSLGERATEKLRTNDTISKSIEVSDDVRENHAGNVDALMTLATAMEKSETREQEFRIAAAQTLVGLAKSISAQNAILESQGALLKSITEGMGIIAKQPARAPKSQGIPTAQPLNKSFAGEDPEGGLNKSMILDAMDDMLQKGAQIVAGEDMLKAATKYETANMITPEMLVEVRKHLGTNKAA